MSARWDDPVMVALDVHLWEGELKASRGRATLSPDSDEFSWNSSSRDREPYDWASDPETDWNVAEGAPGHAGVVGAMVRLGALEALVVVAIVAVVGCAVRWLS